MILSLDSKKNCDFTEERKKNKNQEIFQGEIVNLHFYKKNLKCLWYFKIDTNVLQVVGNIRQWKRMVILGTINFGVALFESQSVEMCSTDRLREGSKAGDRSLSNAYL
jgi:hypothetical protein